ncbi:hypothetical protein F383_00858 [Gossypium arboreum]|uniref:Uncharacterized protein n=1 Tax=Gossypium arboreum TaxID=29729 RepID=A0A0B0NAM2_GOSAR|nr:hypothetical protein F383_00858 [Gossypium arboreum]
MFRIFAFIRLQLIEKIVTLFLWNRSQSFGVLGFWRAHVCGSIKTETAEKELKSVSVIYKLRRISIAEAQR